MSERELPLDLAPPEQDGISQHAVSAGIPEVRRTVDLLGFVALAAGGRHAAASE